MVSGDPVTQLIAHLLEKELLLILDNFEQLLPVVGKGTADPGGGALLARLLQDLPALRLIVTSRERLNLYEEIVCEVPGLDVPEAWVEDPEGFSAVHLFCETARQKNSAFDPSSDELPEIVRACQILEGVPLAIELASDWVRLFSCAQIVKEIERSLDILSTMIQNVPERHRGLRAVFLHSWDLLAEDEQAVCRKLSVFRGGFTLEAAERVADADRLALLKLVDKSLVRQSDVDRYEIHELLRQYAEEQLDSDPGLRGEVKTANTNYYTRLLQALDPGRGQPSQGEIVSAAARDLSHICQPWEWALYKEVLPALEHGLAGVPTFYLLKGPLLEGENLLMAIVVRLRATEQQDSIATKALTFL